jgi:hypothetical protein
MQIRETCVLGTFGASSETELCSVYPVLGIMLLETVLYTVMLAVSTVLYNEARSKTVIYVCEASSL